MCYNNITLLYHPTDHHSCVRTSKNTVWLSIWTSFLSKNKQKHCFIMLLNIILVLEQTETLFYHPTEHHSCVRTSRNTVLLSIWISFLFYKQLNTVLLSKWTTVLCQNKEKPCFIMQLSNILVLEQAKTQLYHPTEHLLVLEQAKQLFYHANKQHSCVRISKTLVYHSSEQHSCVRTKKHNVLSSYWTSFLC